MRAISLTGSVTPIAMRFVIPVAEIKGRYAPRVQDVPIRKGSGGDRADRWATSGSHGSRFNGIADVEIGSWSGAGG